MTTLQLSRLIRDLKATTDLQFVSVSMDFFKDTAEARIQIDESDCAGFDQWLADFRVEFTTTPMTENQVLYRIPVVTL